jgi:hypothetical protein
MALQKQHHQTLKTIIMKNKSIHSLVAAVLVAGFLSGNVHAQNPATVSVSADVVSSFVWRGSLFPGFDGVNIHPALVVSKGGVFGGAWGSGTIDGEAKQVDLFLGYSSGGFTAKVTDYWFGGKYFEYGKNTSGHLFEGTVAYHFGERFPLSLSWNTIFHGSGDLNPDGDKRYSTYIELGYATQLKEISLDFAVGLSPWNSNLYHADSNGLLTNGAKVSNLSVKATKKVHITDSFTLPVFAQLVVNPTREDVNFVVGFSL